MPSTTRKIEDADWKKHKPVISFLYASMELKDLKKYMESEHKFFPRFVIHESVEISQTNTISSEAQLRQQLKKWDLSKNQSKTVWEYAARQYRKRKHDGKDSEIVINGAKIPEKKMKKEVSRYELPFYSGQFPRIIKYIQ